MVSKSVLEILGEHDLFNELIKYEYNNDGKITMISVNSYKANTLARQISNLSQTYFSSTKNQVVDIHLGAFTGLALFSTSGPKINFEIAPIGTISVQFKSEFISAGINQTLHKIYINVLSSVYVIMPTASPKIETLTEVLLTESMVIGDIPSTFLQSSYLDEMLNLVPV